MSVTRLLTVLALGVVLVCVAAAPAAAHRPYEDNDSSYLRVTSTFVRPVGQVLEWVVFRPLHAIATVLEGQTGDDSHPDFRCAGLRPRRGCRSR